MATIQEREFFANLEELLGRVRASSVQNILCFSVLIVNLLRVIQCTSLHPRLALLTDSVANAADGTGGMPLPPPRPLPVFCTCSCVRLRPMLALSVCLRPMYVGGLGMH